MELERQNLKQRQLRDKAERQSSVRICHCKQLCAHDTSPLVQTQRSKGGEHSAKQTDVKRQSKGGNETAGIVALAMLYSAVMGDCLLERDTLTVPLSQEHGHFSWLTPTQDLFA